MLIVNVFTSIKLTRSFEIRVNNMYRLFPIMVVFIMTRAWIKEKILVPDGNRTHDPPA